MFRSKPLDRSWIGTNASCKEGISYDVFLSLKVVLIVANSADPDEMQHYAAFHLGLHSLPEYLFRGFILIAIQCCYSNSSSSFILFVTYF